MNRTSRILIAILIVLAFPATHVLWADDEKAYDEVDIFDRILGIIENPDPIPQVHCIKLTLDPNDPDARIPGQRLDGRPVFEFDRSTEDPYLAWSYEVGTDHDIAFNTWDGDDWDSKIDFLTSSTAEEVDPRMYVDSKNRLYVTWWEDDPDSLMRYVMRNARGWSPVTDIGSGRRPSIAVWRDTVVVAYEREGRTGQEVVFAHSDGDGSFVSQVVAVTDRATRLDPIVHVRADEMWIDWKESDNSIAFSRYQRGKWKIPRIRTWDDPSWLGELTARREIEIEITR
jgi:hypothetical protein